MPVFVCNDVIDHDHLIQCRYHIYAKFQTAIHIMLIYGYIVFFLTGLKDSPCTDKVHIFCNKILTYTVWHVIVPQDRVGNVRDAQFLHDIGCNYFVEWLLTEGIASALEKASSSIYDFPPFFQAAIRGIIRRTEIKIPLSFFQAK